MRLKTAYITMTGMTKLKSETDETDLPGSTVKDPAQATERSQPAVAKKARDAVVMDGVSEMPADTLGDIHCDNPQMIAENVNVYYGKNHAIKDVSLEIGKNQVVALIGPSGCGKSTFLRCLNRMNDSIESARITGNITLDGQDIYSRKLDPGSSAGSHRHRVPETESVSEKHL